MSNPKPASSKGCGCTSCCLTLFVLSGLTAIILVVSILLYGPQLLQFAFQRGPELLGQAVEKVMLSQAQEPLAYPSLPETEETSEAFEARVQNELVGSQDSAQTQLSEADCNRLLQEKIVNAGPLSSMVHGAQITLREGEADLRATLRGNQLSEWISKNLKMPAGAEGSSSGAKQQMHDLFSKAPFVNVEAALSTKSDGVHLESLSLLGFPLPTSLMKEAWNKAKESPNGMDLSKYSFGSVQFAQDSLLIQFPSGGRPEWLKQMFGKNSP